MPAKQTASSVKSQDAIALLIADHKKVQKMFKDFEKLEDEEEKQQLVTEACTELKIHTTIEEEIFYPAAREAIEEENLLNEAEVEHASAKDLIEQLEGTDPSDEMYDAQFTVLGEYVNHHIKEEQDEMFPKVKKAKVDLKELGAQIAQRKQELMVEMGLGDEEEEEETSKRTLRRMSAKSR